MKIAEQVSSEVALLAEQLFSGRELKYLPLFCTLKNLMTSMWTVLCWCPRGITSVHGWQWSIVKFQQCVEKIVTEEGLPQVSSKMDHSFPYSYPSVSYPSVFTTYPLDWVILPSQSMYFQDWSLRRRDSPLDISPGFWWVSLYYWQ